MIKLPLTFKDFDGNEVTEEHYFHLSTTELMEMELASDVPMSEKLKAISSSQNAKEIMGTFRWFVEKAYGTRVNGTSFVKDPAVTKVFMNSLAYDAMFAKLMSDLEFATKFVAGFMPAHLMESAEAVEALSKAGLDAKVLQLPSAVVGSENDKLTGLRHPRNQDGIFWPWAFRKPTDNEILSMGKQQLQDLTVRSTSGWTPPESTPA